jgi:hypothetical protein
MSPGLEALFVTLAVNAIIGTGLFAGKNWLKARIERGVQHRFDQRLEQLRTELRNTEEQFKGELRTKESEIAALRDGVLSGRIGRQALLDKRRLDAVDRLWAAFTALAPYRNVAQMMGVINLEEMQKQPADSPNIRKFFGMIGAVAGQPKPADYPATVERPFVTPLAWAYFSAYSTIVMLSFGMAKAFENGIYDFPKYIKGENVKNLLRTTLPHFSNLVDEWNINLYYLFLDDLEEKLLVELQNMLAGKEQAQSDIELSAAILSAVRAASADKTASEPTASA